jgi:hypothetical protein
LEEAARRWRKERAAGEFSLVKNSLCERRELQGGMTMTEEWMAGAWLQRATLQ